MLSSDAHEAAGAKASKTGRAGALRPAAAATRCLVSRLRASGARPAGVTSLELSGRCCLRNERGRRLLGEAEPGWRVTESSPGPACGLQRPLPAQWRGSELHCRLHVGMGPAEKRSGWTARASSPARCSKRAASQTSSQVATMRQKGFAGCAEQVKRAIAMMATFHLGPLPLTCIAGLGSNRHCSSQANARF